MSPPQVGDVPRSIEEATAPPRTAAAIAALILSLLALAVLEAACVRKATRFEPPTIAAAGGLVYVLPDADDPLRTDLWRARLSDGAVRAFIQTPDRHESEPDWSDRASALVFRARRTGRASQPPARLVIWRDGREEELPGARAHRESWTTWAPTGMRLAYAAVGLRSAGGDSLWNAIAIADLERGQQRFLRRSARGERYARLAFSPDGHRLAVEHRTLRPRASQVMLLGMDGKTQALTDGEMLADRPSFTRNGRFILFTRRAALGAPGDVMRMQPDGSALQPVASGPESDDRWAAASPTRDEVAFLSDRDGRTDAFLTDLAGSRPRNLTGRLDLEVIGLRWSTDGERLALTAVSPGEDTLQQGRLELARIGRAEVLVVDREGRVVFRTRGFAADWMPPWQ